MSPRPVRPISCRSRGDGVSVSTLGAAFLAAIAGALLAGCVDLEATAAVAADGRGRLVLRYDVSRMVAPLDSLQSGRRALPFPLTREALEDALAGSNLVLESFARGEGLDTVSVKATIDFPSLPALAAFLDPSGGRAVFSEEGGRRRLRLVLTEGASDLDPEVGRLIDTAFAGNRVSLTLVLASPVVSAGIGSASGGRAEYSSSAAALMKSAEPVVWEIVW